MKPALKILLFCLSTLLLIGCDRVTKELAREHLKNKASVSYFHNTVRLVYAENTGAALSMGDELSRTASFWLLSIFPLLFLLGLGYYTISHSREWPFRKIFTFALIIAGGLGNIFDRLLYDRHVTDFMIISIRPVQTGIFNFADVCVTIGAIGLVFFLREKGHRKNVATKI
ncbi:MAG: lspA [Sediminibacterium sp.]|nr:lspA [Sediminibacterium sp.]